jgi:CubicO group peptidase (beta-lactamase class C family)
MRISPTLVGAALLALSVTAPAAPLAQVPALPTASPEAVGMSSERLQRIPQRMQEYIDAGELAGAVTLVARDGQIVHLEAQGYRDREAGVAMEADDIFFIMSMTKTIVSTGLMMLHEEGKFLLGDPVSRWLPEFAGMEVRVADGENGVRYVPARPITIRHLLTHTAGLVGGRGYFGPPIPEGESWVNRSPAAQPQPGDSPIRAEVRQIANSPLNFQPGERWQYGAATDVVAALIEVISGQSVDDFLRERMFEPLGMHDTHYNLPPEKWNRRARVYSAQRQNDWQIVGQPLTDPERTDLFGGVAGLYSTATDYFRFAQMVLNGGELGGVRLMSPKTINLMISNHIGDLVPGAGTGAGYRFGLGYSIITDVGQARESLSPGSYGWMGIWGTYYVSDPVENLLAITMIQLTPYSHRNFREDVGTIATQAIIEPRSPQQRRIQAYEPID